MVSSLDLYQVFFHTARCCSASQAAEALFVSPSSVNRALKQLESQLDLQLFIRSSTGLKLTSEGEMLYQKLIPVFEMLEEAEHSVTELKNVSSGSLRVAVNDLAAEWIVSLARDHIARQYPGFALAVSTLDMEDMLRILDAGYVDLAVIFEQNNGDYTFTDSRIRDLEISRTFYGEFQDSFYTGPGSGIPAEGNVSLQELSALPFICPVTPSPAVSRYLSVLRPQGLTDRDFPVDGPRHRLQLTCMNLGFSYFPDYFVRQEVRNRRIRKVQGDFPTGSSVLYALSSKKHPATGAMNYFLKLFLQPVF